MKKFRKISALMLALALVCLCAASAFAVKDTFDEDFEGYGLSMTREVRNNYAMGSITVDADGGLLRRVTIETWYLAEDSRGNVFTDKWTPNVTSSTYSHPGVTVQKTWTTAEFDSKDIFSLSYINATFKAEVYARGTTMTYNSGPCYLAYLLE